MDATIVLQQLACSFMGVLAVPLPPAMSLAKLSDVIREVGAKVVFTMPSRRESLRGAGAPVYDLPTCVEAPSVGAHAAVLGELLQLSLQHDENATYMLQPTSGTTGKAKHVVRSHSAFTRFASIFAEQAKLGADEQVLMVTALTHGTGQYSFALALHLAAPMLLPSAIGTATPLEEVRALDPTMMMMPPRVVRALFEQHQRSGRTRSDRWRKGYIGKILADVELKNDSDGELLAKTPGMMEGYFGAPELTQAAFTDDGFDRTGDLCEITADGWLRYSGRKRDVFNTYSENNIHPTRIEELLEKKPWVGQAVLLGDQRPYLVALLTVDQAPDRDAELGYLEEEKFRDLYRMAASDIEELNASLEVDEKVRRFARFGRPMPDELYSIVGHGEARRDRAGLAAAYSR